MPQYVIQVKVNAPEGLDVGSLLADYIENGKDYHREVIGDDSPWQAVAVDFPRVDVDPRLAFEAKWHDIKVEVEGIT